MKIADVGWIGPAQAEKLSAAGVINDEDLLTRGATRDGRRGLAEATGIREQVILSWVNRVELLRLEGIRPEHVNLLAAAGIDGIAELARRDARHLAETLGELNRTRATMREAPFVGEVARWIEAAQTSPRTVDD